MSAGKEMKKPYQARAAVHLVTKASVHAAWQMCIHAEMLAQLVHDIVALFVIRAPHSIAPNTIASPPEVNKEFSHGKAS
jgi:hypothetical protein